MYSRCEQFGFDRDKINKRLAFLRLNKTDHKLAQLLKSSVIEPNLDSIIDRFYETLLFHSESRKWLMDGDTIHKLKRTQSAYLLSLGINFDTEEYFEERLRVGVMHAVIGLPLSLYQGAYCNLIQYIIDAFPDSIRSDNKTCSDLTKFIVKITSLDITLATETYHYSHVSDLENEIVSSHSREQKFRNLAESDSLTGLCDRNHSFNLLAAAIDRARSSSVTLCLLMVDIDHFKQINDTYGHQSGDEVLVQVAEALGKSLRSHDIAGRYGGEEFIIGLFGVTLDVAEKIAERIRSSIANTPLKINDHVVNITVSIGASILQVGDDLPSLIRRSDTALYSAKNSGRNCVIFG